MEYWKRKGGSSDSQKVIGVFPPQKQAMAKDEVLEIHLSLSNGAAINLDSEDQVMLSPSMVFYEPESLTKICQLMSTTDSSKLIKATSAEYLRDHILISFDFGKQRGDPPMSKGDCYTLICEEQATKQSLFMSAAQTNYEYCFGDSDA